DVESMIRDLVGVAVRLVERERTESIRPEVERKVNRLLLDMLDIKRPKPKPKRQPVFDNPIMKHAFEMFGQKMEDGYPDETPAPENGDEKRHLQHRKRLEKRIAAGEMDDALVEIEVDEASHPFVQVFTAQGLEEMGLDASNIGSPFPAK